MRVDISPEQLVPLWQKPAAQVLLACLKELQQGPRVWSLKATHTEIVQEQQSDAQSRREITSYLSNIIKSGLSWIGDDDAREEIWSEAGKRMAERCGRTALGEITRCWPLKGKRYAPFELRIREPPLTEDSLGLKTWASSYLLAQHLDDISTQALSHLLTSSGDAFTETVLELGSGTGLLGLAAACIWKTKVILTDLPIIMDNLTHNVEANRRTAESCGGFTEAAALTWGGGSDESDARFGTLHQFKVVLVADPLYDDTHPALLAGAVDEQLSHDRDARLVVMVPLRDANTRNLLATFRKALAERGAPLTCVQENVLVGQDDWGEEGEVHTVECWWGVFQRL